MQRTGTNGNRSLVRAENRMAASVCGVHPVVWMADGMKSGEVEEARWPRPLCGLKTNTGES